MYLFTRTVIFVVKIGYNSLGFGCAHSPLLFASHFGQKIRRVQHAHSPIVSHR